ncbi:MAG TPA: ribbon-helix-helix domain-containing protein [Candidatus Nanoarchaeia archaeon]|nr:ribbon-helix-helix domain-containing protein [Candidatus Nanoarchaeia archaeon]
MKLITLKLPQSNIDGLNRLVVANLWPNRSEAIRVAIHGFFQAEVTTFADLGKLKRENDRAQAVLEASS